MTHNWKKLHKLQLKFQFVKPCGIWGIPHKSHTCNVLMDATRNFNEQFAIFNYGKLTKLIHLRFSAESWINWINEFKNNKNNSWKLDASPWAIYRLTPVQALNLIYVNVSQSCSVCRVSNAYSWGTPSSLPLCGLSGSPVLLTLQAEKLKYLDKPKGVARNKNGGKKQQQQHARWEQGMLERERNERR